MARLIFLVVAIALVYWLLRRFRQGQDDIRDPAGAEDMVSCARCGLNLPRSEAVQDAAGRNYCCEAHRRESVQD